MLSHSGICMASLEILQDSHNNPNDRLGSNSTEDGHTPVPGCPADNTHRKAWTRFRSVNSCSSTNACRTWMLNSSLSEDRQETGESTCQTLILTSTHCDPKKMAYPESQALSPLSLAIHSREAVGLALFAN